VANAAFGPEGEFPTALEAAAETTVWLYKKIPLIKAYLDGQGRSKSFNTMLEA